jgi:hypothetical protein
MSSGTKFLSNDGTAFLVLSTDDLSPQDVVKRVKSVANECLNSLSGGELNGVLVYSGGAVNLLPVEELSDDDAVQAIFENQISLCLSNLDDYDWERCLALVSGDAACDFMVVGMHPNYDDPVTQRYDNGDLDTGIVESRDEEEHMTARARELFDAISRGPSS